MDQTNHSRGERRWTAVLCADLADFTGMSNVLGPERTYEMLREVIDVARTQIEACGGQIIDYAGDAVFAVFGAPRAVENASLDACKAALSVQQEIDKAAPRFSKDFGVEPKFRIGLAGGSVVFGSLGRGERLDINVLGDAVNLAMRLQKETDSGTVICSDEIFNQVEGMVISGARQQVSLKGFKPSQGMYRIVGLLDTQSAFEGRLKRGSTTFWNRHKEFEALNNWLEYGYTKAPLLDVDGAAGVGKSRLLHEFVLSVGEAADVIMGQCHFNAQQKTLEPLLEIIRVGIDWQKTDDADAVAAKLAEIVDRDEQSFGYLVGLVGEFAQNDDERALTNGPSVRVLCEQALFALAEQKPRVILIEDVHWIDPVSEAVLGSVLDKHNDRGIRIITTRRSHIASAWTARDDVAHLTIFPLNKECVEDLVLELASAERATPALMELVIDKSERNPLFVEEIVRYLQFSGGISVEAGVADLVSGHNTAVVSGNLQHLIMSRFDGLPEQDRAHLVHAAAKGRRFTGAFLDHCHSKGAAQEVEACLERAVDAGIIEQDPTAGPDGWRFSHALIGDAIYQSLLGPHRREVHKTIAGALEDNAGDRLHVLSEELATHFQAAGNPAKAVQYLYRSAQKSYEVFSIVHADAQLSSAFDLIENTPDLVDDQMFGQMLVLWARTLEVYGNFRKLTVILEHHLPRLRRAEVSEALAMCVAMKSLARCHANDFKRAQQLANEALELAVESASEVGLIWAKVVQMRINVDSGNGTVEDTVALYDEVKPAAEKMADSHLIQLSTYVVMTAYRSIGRLKRANTYIDWLVDYGRTNNRTRALAMASWAQCINHLVRDELDEALTAAEQNLKYTVPPTADWRVATVGKTVAKLRRGDPDVTPDDLRVHIETTGMFEDSSLHNAAKSQLVIQLLSRGRIYEGWTSLLRSLRQEDVTLSPEIYRLYHLVMAEFLMAVAGIITSDAPRPKMGIKDILMALRLKIGARKAAEKALNTYLELAPVDSGYFIARIKRDLGMIEASRGNREAANALFAQSVEMYRAEGMETAAAQVLELVQD